MEVVTGAMSTLLPMLGDLLTQEYNLQKSTRGEIKFLKAELESMEAALIKISEAPLDQPPDIQVKLWARDVRDLSYEMEDSVDRFRVHLECREQKKPHSFMGFIHRCMDMLAKGNIQHKIGIDIKDVKRRINEISERRDRYKVDCVAPKPTGTSTDTLRQFAFFQKASELIGTEKKSDAIVRMLTEGDEKQLKMVSVVGFGGVGKTTIANVVYRKLLMDFDSGAFVSISLNPNMEKIFKSLLYQFDNDKYKNIMNESAWSETQLIRETRDFLRNKRYLILIDDIWKKSVWKNIRRALIENECGSRVIATTRILDVAEEVGAVYELEPLSTSDSRRLFNQRIFGTEDKCPPTQLAEVSENILRKCGGVPLAIITLASMLAGKKGHENTYTYWSKVYKSMGSGPENNPDFEDLRILYVSYYDLPPNLKTCLLYLSLYPEDYQIQAKELIWKWIGEGFVREEQGKSLYEVGEAYLDELINKGLIQPMRIVHNKARSCRVHDMVLDLIALLSNEENFLTTLSGQQPRSVSSKVPRSVPSKVRRLSLQTSKEEDAKQMATISLSSVRSLTVFSGSLSLLSALSGFPVLRTLDLSDFREVGNHHMKHICNLLHLRFLSLANTSITEIPKEIGNLHLLQVLDISSNSLKTLPSSFVQLRQLVFVDMGDTLVSTSLRLMSSLPSLSSLTIGLKELREEDLQVLGSMPSLRDLSIYVLSPTRGRKERLVIDNGCPFQYLTRLCIKLKGIDFVFTQGTLQMLQILELDFSLNITNQRSIQNSRSFSGLPPPPCYPPRYVVHDQFDYDQFDDNQFGDFHFGLENLPSLEHVYVVANGVYGGELKESRENAIRKVLDINPNKPTLTFDTEQACAIM